MLTPYYSGPGATIYCGDALQILRTMPSGRSNGVTIPECVSPSVVTRENT